MISKIFAMQNLISENSQILWLFFERENGQALTAEWHPLPMSDLAQYLHRDCFDVLDVSATTSFGD